MSSSGEEEETGPSVDSNDPEERIAARRLRIQRRIEIAKRAAMGEDPNDKKEVKEEMSKSRKQIEESRLRLTKLRQDGNELVSNIRVAGDAREGIRRIEEEDSQRQRKEKLEAEAKAGAERFEEITKKWESALQKEIPQDLHDMLMQQKQSCDSMIDEKNKLINDFQMELKGKDDQYVKDLKKQAEDIDLMIERMEEQIKNVTSANRQELDQIEKAFITERSELLEVQHKKWETSMQQRREKEVEYMKMRDKRVEDFEKQLQHLRVQDAEEYNQVKIKLETDVQILEQQLQQMRATYQLNQEKLEYNFQVLKKRDEENTITKSQQKRKITRLQDVLNILKIKLQKQEKQYRDENQSLTDDYKRIKEQFKELQKKSHHFTAADAQKFHDVWCMNEEECKDLLRKVLEQDRLVMEQQLGLQYTYPDTLFTDNVGPIVIDPMAGKGASAMQVVQEVLAATAENSKETVDADDTTLAGSVVEGQENEEDAADKKSTIQAKISARTIKQVLELLCDEGGFLIERKLEKLLAPLEKDEQSLMKLDAIFAALGVDTEDDIFQLSTYFLKYLKEQEAKQAEAVPEAPKEGVELELSESAEGKEEAEIESVDVDAEVQKVTEAPSDDVSVHESVRSDKGGELIHPNEAVRALRAFVEDHKKQTRSEQTNKPQFKITSNEERDNCMDAEYWAKYPDIVSAKTERVWDALIQGLEDYSSVLTSRGELITETDGLRQQNAELRMLLHQYVNSKVNAELEIPPTRVLQMELNHV